MKTHFEMAKEAGLRDSVNLKRFAELVRADEREACAKVCDAWDEWAGTQGILAKAIRARGQEGEKI